MGDNKFVQIIVATIFMMNVIMIGVIARNTLTLSDIQTRDATLNIAHKNIADRVEAIEDWRKLTQSTRFTASDGATLRKEIAIRFSEVNSRLAEIERRLANDKGGR